MSAVVFHRLDREAALERLRRWAQEDLAGRPEVSEVRLIGSLARDEHSARSDADVVIVVDHADEPAAARGAAYLPSRPIGVPLDILVFTEDEAAAWSPRFRAEAEQAISLWHR